MGPGLLEYFDRNTDALGPFQYKDTVLPKKEFGL